MPRAPRRVTAIATLGLLLCTTSCRSQRESSRAPVPGAAPGQGQSSAGWDAYLQRYLDEYFALRPDVAVVQGRHEYDGLFPDWSAQGLQGTLDWLHRQQETAGHFAEAGLSPEQRFERRYLLAETDKQLFWLESARWPWRCPAFYSDAFDPDIYVSRPYASLPVRMRAYTRWAEHVPAAAAQLRANLRTPSPKSYVELGVQVYGGLASFCREDVPRIFDAVHDPALRGRFEVANALAVSAARQTASWFEAQRAGATGAYALGEELYSEMLRRTLGVDTPLAELQALAQGDLERNLASLRSACLELEPALGLEACLSQVLADKPVGGPVAAARAQLGALESFLIQHAIVSIPGEELAEVKEAPAHKRWNSAYIDIPGPWEDGLPSVYCIAPPDPKWTPKERQDYIPCEADLLYTSVHEVWPGHFLQGLHANRARSKFGRVFGDYAFVEGWAHYAEEMMWEQGLGQGDPKQHIGQLLNALLRNVRFVSALGLHTRGMTVEESERLFREQGFQDPGNARQQAARGTFDPGYLAYTLGKLMIFKLRADWMAEHGGKASLREFHDQLLSYGGPQLPLVRQALLRNPGAAIL